MAETVFCHVLFSKLCEESIDLDELGMMMSRGRAQQESPITSDVKLHASQELAGKVVEFMLVFTHKKHQTRRLQLFMAADCQI